MKLGPKVGRNSPCPCNSGRKFKRCHGRLVTDTRFPSRPLEESQLRPEIVAKIRDMQTKVQRQQEWPQKYGAITPSVHATWSDGTRLASAGGALWRVESDETWHGFIYDLLRTNLGVDWFDAELSKPEAERHILAEWFVDVCQRELDGRQRFSRGVQGQDTGATLAFRSVAYDAFCLMQVGALSPKMLGRLTLSAQSRI
jgi:hypothetical protein